MHQQLLSNSYTPQRSICFAVRHPKTREIFAGDFQDRIIHHLIVGVLEPIFEPCFIHQSFACRKRKGTHSAVKALKKALAKVTKNYTTPAFYGEFDIKSFFCSIDKDILFKIISNKLKKSMFLARYTHTIDLIKKIIYHDPTSSFYIKGDKDLLKTIPPHKSLFGTSKGKGLPIGNLTSQFFANIYLNELDQFVKRDLKVKYYFRYVDDFIILDRDPDKIKIHRDHIQEFLQKELKLKIHPNKERYGSVYKGIEFVGQFIKPQYSLIRRRTVKNLKSKLYFFNHGLIFVSNNQMQKILPLSSPPSRDQLLQIMQTLNSYYGLLLHANCYNLRKNIYYRHFGILKKYLKPVKNYSYFELKNPHYIS